MKTLNFYTFKERFPNDGEHIIFFKTGIHGSVSMNYGVVEHSWFNPDTGDMYTVYDENDILTTEPPEEGCELVFHIDGREVHEDDYYCLQDTIAEELYGE